jgi:hypothetical protein
MDGTPLFERPSRASGEGSHQRWPVTASGGGPIWVDISTAINWVQRFHETGSVKPDQIGGYRPKKIAGGTATG